MLQRSVERQLVARALEGDADAVGALIQAHQDALYAFILRMSGHPQTAEDVVQEAFVRVLRNLDRFDARYRFSTWLFTIAKRLYVNAAQKRRPTYDTTTVGVQRGRDPSPGGVSAGRETMRNARSVLRHALASLNEQQREIILLFHQQSWSITAISRHLDMPEGTVKSHLHRARRRMRQIIEADEASHRMAREVWS